MVLRLLDTTGTWKVNNDPIYVPDADITIQHSHIASEDSGRDEAGYMHIHWLRTDMHKVGLKYKLITGAELEYLRERMQGKTFSFTFAHENGVKTIQGYTGEIQGTLYTRMHDTDIYKDVAINVVEL